jgi:hypothetical protein
MKFRIWDGEKMHYPTFGDCWFLTGDGFVYSLDLEYMPDMMISVPAMKPIASAIAMLATGLTDKNGKEMYEGDMYRNTFDGINYVIVWRPGECVAENHWHDGDIRTPFADLGFPGDDLPDRYEILGNRYENPEMVR